MEMFKELANLPYSKGFQERAVDKYIQDYTEQNEVTPTITVLFASLISTARNIDAQVAKGREISRNMATLLDIINRITELTDAASVDDDELAELTQIAQL